MLFKLVLQSNYLPYRVLQTINILTILIQVLNKSCKLLFALFHTVFYRNLFSCKLPQFLVNACSLSCILASNIIYQCSMCLFILLLGLFMLLFHYIQFILSAFDFLSEFDTLRFQLIELLSTACCISRRIANQFSAFYQRFLLLLKLISYFVILLKSLCVLNLVLLSIFFRNFQFFCLVFSRLL
jgi:hypothetical protein